MPETYEIQTRYKGEDADDAWGTWNWWDRFPCSPDTAYDAALNAYFGHPGADKKGRLTIEDKGTGKTQFRLRRKP